MILHQQIWVCLPSSEVAAGHLGLGWPADLVAFSGAGSGLSSGTRDLQGHRPFTFLRGQ